MIPASIRNNNPGAQEPGFASQRWGSTTYETLRWEDDNGKVHTNRCATFATHYHGGAALFTLLAEGKYYRNKPIQEAIATWCGGHSASQYIDHMERSTGTKRTALLTNERIKDPDIAVPIAMAIAQFEAGRNKKTKEWVPVPLDEDDWREIHDMAFFGKPVAPKPSIDNDVPFQKPEGARRENIILWTWRTVKATLVSISTVGIMETISPVTPSEFIIPAVPQNVKQSISNLGSWSDVVSGQTWQMLLLGSLAFAAVWLVGKVRS